MRFLFLFFYDWLILPQVYSRPGKFMKVALLFFPLALTRAQDTTYNCNGWSQFTIGSYLVENNVWGQGNITDFTQCIYRTGSGDDIHFGWNWDWPVAVRMSRRTRKWCLAKNLGAAVPQIRHYRSRSKTWMNFTWPMTWIW